MQQIQVQVVRAEPSEAPLASAADPQLGIDSRSRFVAVGIFVILWRGLFLAYLRSLVVQLLPSNRECQSRPRTRALRATVAIRATTYKKSR